MYLPKETLILLSLHSYFEFGRTAYAITQQSIISDETLFYNT
jgi:hypothetical protein